MTCEHSRVSDSVLIARVVVFGAVCLLLAMLAGCWIVNEWNLRAIEKVGGKVQVRPKNENNFGSPDLQVVPEVQK